MRLTDALALSHVPRWSITAHSRPQTVSDHTYRVLVIAVELAARTGITLHVADFLRILYHDAHESWTADVPAPMKKELEKIFDFEKTVPWMKGVPKYSSPGAERIASLADKIEAYTFIGKYGVGEQSREIAQGCLDVVREMTRDDPDWTRVVGSVIVAIMEETGRGFKAREE